MDKHLFKKNSKTKKGLTVLTYFCIEAQPPSTVKQPPTQEGNPSAGREKRINIQQHPIIMQQDKTSTLTKEGVCFSQGVGFKLIRQRNPEGRTDNTYQPATLRDGIPLTCF